MFACGLLIVFVLHVIISLGDCYNKKFQEHQHLCSRRIMITLSDPSHNETIQDADDKNCDMYRGKKSLCKQKWIPSEVQTYDSL